MATEPTTKLMTAEELMALPDDGWRYELIEGVLHRMPPGGLEHSDIGSELLARLRVFGRESGIGRAFGADAGVFFEQDPDTVRVPDVAFVRTERLPPADEWIGLSRVIPDLVCEVVSPSDRPGQVTAKVAFYLERGVPMVWVLRPRPRSVTVHRPGAEPRVLGEGDVLDGEDLLPGFSLPVADVFP
jgi:Uma2 family endonuclease